MTGKIQLLSELTINQIAAGEVIENPASALKELVENAIDAGARKVTIEVMGGGLQLIRISDDGCGMDKNDAFRAFERFATSKIRELDDLSLLSTMGFRGEALAAISSISKISLRTSAENEVGTAIEIEAGKIVHSAPCGRTRGTTIEVRSLFYNVPARRKFQKSPSACAADITRTASLLALAHPEVAFELISQERLVFSSPSSMSPGRTDRIQDILGEGFLTDSLSLEMSEGGIKLSGLIGQPLQSRPNRTGQYLFINERPVYSPQISYAVKDGYGTRLPSDRYPIFVLYLHIPPDQLDVNVHPQKKEVRIHDERRVKALIQQAVSSSLQKHELPNMPVIGSAPDFSQSLPWESETPSFSNFSEAPVFRFAESSSSSSELALLPESSDSPKPIGLFSRYLLLDSQSLPRFTEEGIVMVDLSLVRSRLIFDALLSSDRSEKVGSQGLLLPLTFEFTTAHSSLLEENIGEIQKMSIGIHSLGKNVFIIDSLPSFLPEERVKDFLLLIVDELADAGPARDKRSERLALIAARAAASEKKSFSQREALLLFEELMRSSSPYFCPYGKPTMIQVTSDEITKLFAAKKAP
ncbi:MAG: DNA mismatch repair endonuclease MutL [Chlamydiales bacterium]|nr:DNA mismatch repair endonuclease MutL [Chlamydiales bacterium]